jgi:tetratricopeptide (TPR) repeat protein
MLDWLWTFLQSKDNREVLAWIAGGIATIATGFWVVVKFFAEKRKKASSGMPIQIAQGDRGGFSAAQNLTTGNITQNIGLDAEAVKRQIAEPIHGQLAAANEQLIAAMRIEMARGRGIDPIKLLPLFEHLGHRGLSLEEIREGAEEAIAEMIALSKSQVVPSNEGHDIDATIGAAREKLAGLDTKGARSVLESKIVEEETARCQRLVPLLEEKAKVERISYDYDAAKATLKQLLALDPDRVWRWIELGDLYVTTGSVQDALSAYRSAGDAARRTGDERDLSVSFNKIGDVQVAQGDLAGALKSYRDSLAIRERLAKSDPANAEWQRDLSVSFNNIGNVQVAQGDLAGALKSYSDDLAIAERLAKSDPANAEWQRDLSVSFEKVGDVQVAQGDFAGALKSYRDTLAIREWLAKSDPRNAGWQRDLSVSFNKVGDVQVAQGDLAGALTSYRDSLAIRERLAKSDARNAEWQRDLLVSFEKIGDVQLIQGDLAGALKSYRDSFAISERLAKSDAENAAWQRTLAVSHAKLAFIYEKRGEASKRIDTLQKGYSIMRRLTQISPENAVWKRDLAQFEQEIADAER